MSHERQTGLQVDEICAMLAGELPSLFYPGCLLANELGIIALGEGPEAHEAQEQLERLLATATDAHIKYAAYGCSMGLLDVKRVSDMDLITALCDFEDRPENADIIATFAERQN